MSAPNLCVEVRQVDIGSHARAVVRVTTRQWGDAVAYEQWIPIPYGWGAHADDIDAAVARAIGKDDDS
jgi:hypothetical protein